MGTHPLFESDFDCLTDMNRPEQQNVWHDMVKSMQVAKKYTETAMINSVAFSMDGENFVTASDDDTLSVYSNDDGKLKRLLYSKKYGCQNVKLTHHPTQIIYTSSKQDHAIRYHRYTPTNTCDTSQVIRGWCRRFQC